MAKSKNTFLWIAGSVAALVLLTNSNKNNTNNAVSGLSSKDKIDYNKILDFIKNFNQNNEYKKESLKEYNAKFKKELDYLK